MDPFVADCSVTIAWTIHSQSSESTESLLNQVEAGVRFVVPTLWPFEIANTLLVLTRRGRITHEDAARAGKALALLNPIIDEEGHRLAMTETSRLAAKYSLTVYDAAYLELALRRRLPLASRDNALNTAARKLKLRTLL